MPEQIETVIIGGGQAGLAMSYWLTQQRREHVILERGRLGERWRSERWDSFMLQTPNWANDLPGLAYAGDDPEEPDEACARLSPDMRAAPRRSGTGSAAADTCSCGYQACIR